MAETDTFADNSPTPRRSQAWRSHSNMFRSDPTEAKIGEFCGGIEPENRMDLPQGSTRFAAGRSDFNDWPEPHAEQSSLGFPDRIPSDGRPKPEGEQADNPQSPLGCFGSPAICATSAATSATMATDRERELKYCAETMNFLGPEHTLAENSPTRTTTIGLETISTSALSTRSGDLGPRLFSHDGKSTFIDQGQNQMLEGQLLGRQDTAPEDSLAASSSSLGQNPQIRNARRYFEWCGRESMGPHQEGTNLPMGEVGNACRSCSPACSNGNLSRIASLDWNASPSTRDNINDCFILSDGPSEDFPPPDSVPSLGRQVTRAAEKILCRFEGRFGASDSAEARRPQLGEFSQSPLGTSPESPAPIIPEEGEESEFDLDDDFDISERHSQADSQSFTTEIASPSAFPRVGRSSQFSREHILSEKESAAFTEDSVKLANPQKPDDVWGLFSHSRDEKNKSPAADHHSVQRHTSSGRPDNACKRTETDDPSRLIPPQVLAAERDAESQTPLNRQGSVQATCPPLGEAPGQEAVSSIGQPQAPQTSPTLDPDRMLTALHEGHRGNAPR